MLNNIFTFLHLSTLTSIYSLLSEPTGASNTTTLGADSLRNVFDVSNKSSLTNIYNPVGEDVCFDPQPREYRLPTDRGDCFAAADQIAGLGTLSVPLIFSRQPGADIKLPVDLRFGRCCIHFNMPHPGDQDFLELNAVFTTAIEVALKCTIGEHKYGGRVYLGPRGLLYMIMGGCSPTGIISSPATPPSTKAEPIEQTVGGLSTFPQALDLEHAPNKRTAANAVKDECFDQRISVPSLNLTTIEDCSEAANALVHGREPYKALIFARKSNVGFHLPQTVQHGSCIVSIDVASDDEYDFFMPMVV